MALMNETLAKHPSNPEMSVGDTPLVVTDHHDNSGVARVTLNRPDRRNSLSRAMMAAICDALKALEDDPNVRVILLCAKGTVFSAGHDLKEITAARQDSDGGKAFFEATMADCVRLMLAVTRSSKPIIAVVGGLATAAGCQLVASCDLAVASHEASFATPGVHIGLFCSTPMVALSRNIPRKRAMEMLLTGVPISAHQAAEWGLVNQVVAAEELDQSALALANLITSKPPVTLRMGKAAFYDQLEMSLTDAYAHTAEVMVENMLHAEAKEGMDAFINKRPADWQNSSS